MVDYNEVTAKEYFEKKKEVLNSLGRTSSICYRVECLNCPLNKNDKYNCSELEIEKPQEAIEAIMEYEIPVDWSKVPVDTKILVKNYEGRAWVKRYFAKYKNGKVYAFSNGADSFTVEDENCVADWEYAKLYEGEE